MWCACVCVWGCGVCVSVVYVCRVCDVGVSVIVCVGLYV